MRLDGNSTCYNTAHKGSVRYPGELKPPLLVLERPVLATVLATDPCTASKADQSRTQSLDVDGFVFLIGYHCTWPAASSC
jgi:hypothetical protein